MGSPAVKMDELYESSIDRLLVARVPLDDVCAKRKLGQNRRASEGCTCA